MTGFTLDRHVYTAKPCPHCATPCITHDWCARCGRSVNTRGEPMTQRSEADDRARAILQDHRAGLHEEYETENGCRYPGCDDAWWQLTSEPNRNE